MKWVTCWILCVAIVADQADRGLASSRLLTPCVPQTTHFNVSLLYSDTLVVLANSSQCSSSFNPTAFYTQLERADDSTIFDDVTSIKFAVRRANRDGIVSWSVPLDVELNGTSISQHYFSVNHTMFPIQVTSNSPQSPVYIGDGITLSSLPLFYIDVYTYSTTPLFYSIFVEPVNNFTLNIINASDSATQLTTISPAAPQVFYFKFPTEFDAVTVEVRNTSKAVGCAYVSVQNNTCPFNELLLDDTLGKGMYQTLTEKALITVETKWIQNREFIVVLVAANYSTCHDPPLNQADLYDFMNHGQQVEIKIKKLKMINEYTLAVLFPILLSIGIAICSSVAVCCCVTILCEPCCVLIVCKKNAKRCGLCYHFGPCRCACVLKQLVDDNIIDTRRESNSFRHFVCTCCEKDNPEGELGIPCGDSDVKCDTQQAESEKTPLAENIQQSGGSATVRDQIQKRHLEYAWGAIIVGIFYALPTTQLLIFHQRILHWSGDEDACYYNFMCTRPAFQLSAFNNVWSNACYVLLGLWFCAIVGFRQCYAYYQSKFKFTTEAQKKYLMTHGIHQHFGVYYALGIGLAFEGIMGSFYHVCPNNSNFQFDTAFMYIIGGLIIVKLIHMRDSTVTTNAFAVFISLGVVILFTIIGIHSDRHNSFAVKLTFGLLMVLIALPVILVSFFAIKICKHHRRRKQLEDKADRKVTAYAAIKKKVCCKWYTLRIAIILLLNVVMCTIFLTVSYHGIASTVLTIIVINALLLLLLYSITKLLHGEPLTFLSLSLPVVIAALTIFAFYFYGTVTEWAKPPAESRAMNGECIFMDFYDKHDVWHMSFACTMFFIILFLLIIDDGVLHKERKVLKTF